jgi:hypothetical protein
MRRAVGNGDGTASGTAGDSQPPSEPR